MGQDTDSLTSVDIEPKSKHSKRTHTPRDIETIEVVTDNPAVLAPVPAASLTTVPSVPFTESMEGVTDPIIAAADADDIAETRAEMTDTIEAIKTKLNPHLLMDEAKESIEETVAEARVEVMDAACSLVGRAMDTTQKVARRIQEAIRENPMQAAAVGVIVGAILVRGIVGRYSRG